MLNKIKSIIPNNIKSEICAFLKPEKIKNFKMYKNKKKFIIFLAGYYQNLGDMALTYSQKKFIEQNFPQYEILIIPSTKTYSYMRNLKSICTPEDIITIIGGGNMDDIYVSLEDARRYVIKNFHNNRIISFPQTMIFSNTNFGKKRLKKTINTYNKHKNLYIFAREKNSLTRMKKSFTKAAIGFCPDMVLYLNKMETQFTRNGIICCLRQDAEINLSKEEYDNIRKFLNKKYHNVYFTDTVNISLSECTPEKYEDTLNRFWNLLKRSKVVITDRLHCMIFCAITKTPCVVMDNSNHKISGVYDAWIKDLGYIKMMKDHKIDKLQENIELLLNINVDDFPALNLQTEFKDLADACKIK
ncbi:MAG: polysaccharide pyruvyl transferase family protein [Clostridiaceae bacterium]